ncbi:hypothetical protein LSAT2_026538 [Lamellibrachia satsuma]|nr:hypothetical protein LSAT2_026538 [Lamellibrachia satsuma]
MVFLLPTESGEKVTLAITVLLAMMVFLTVIMQNVPTTSLVIPLLVRFNTMATQRTADAQSPINLSQLHLETHDVLQRLRRAYEEEDADVRTDTLLIALSSRKRSIQHDDKHSKTAITTTTNVFTTAVVSTTATLLTTITVAGDATINVVMLICTDDNINTSSLITHIILPHTNDHTNRKPMEQFFGAMIAHFTMTILLVVFVVNVHHRATYCDRPPSWVRRWFLQRLSRVFRMRMPNVSGEMSPYAIPKQPDDVAKGCLVVCDEGMLNPSCPANGMRGTSDDSSSTFMDNCLSVPSSQCQSVRRPHAGINSANDEGLMDGKKDVNEWHQVARVLDRLFLFIYLILTGVYAFVVFGILM